MEALLRNVWADIRERGPRYWIFAGIFILTGVALSGYLDRHYFLLGPRYAAYQLLQSTAPGNSPHARRVVFVSIGDNEFWKLDLERRIPVKRDYLARLTAALDKADPAIIALDFTLRSPVADGTIVETPIYEKETLELVEAVEMTKNAAIVLPLTVNEYGYDLKTESYSLDSNIFGTYRFKNPRVSWGYTNLSLDIRQIPLFLRLRNQERVPSFSQEIVTKLDPRNQSARRSSGTVFGSFMPMAGFVMVPANDVLSNPEGTWRDKVRHQAVIVGSFAHKDAFERGPYIDGFATPVGAVPGAAVHANYVEALLHDHVFPLVPDWVRNLLEVVLSFLVSIVLVRSISPLAKARYFAALIGSAFLLSYFLQQNIGMVFDPFLPLVFVAAHSIGERAFGPRHSHSSGAQALDVAHGL